LWISLRLTARIAIPSQSWGLSLLLAKSYLLVAEHAQAHDETQSPSEDDVEEVTHTTIEGRDESSRAADALAEERDRSREREFAAQVRAHESVIDDWTEHHSDRPDDVREAVWLDPLFEPEDPSEAEHRFVKTRKIRRRTLEWRGDLP